MTLEEYLRKAMDVGFYNFHIKPSIRNGVGGELAFFIHPSNANGSTKHYIVQDNHLTPMDDSWAEPDPEERTPEFEPMSEVES
jgi:hypothetical protein